MLPHWNNLLVAGSNSGFNIRFSASFSGHMNSGNTGITTRVIRHIIERARRDYERN